MADFTRRIHVALAAMRKQGIPVVDSNLWHGFAIDDQIPRVPLGD